MDIRYELGKRAIREKDMTSTSFRIAPADLVTLKNFVKDEHVWMPDVLANLARLIRTADAEGKGDVDFIRDVLKIFKRSESFYRSITQDPVDFIIIYRKFSEVMKNLDAIYKNSCDESNPGFPRDFNDPNSPKVLSMGVDDLTLSVPDRMDLVKAADIMEREREYRT